MANDHLRALLVQRPDGQVQLRGGYKAVEELADAAREALRSMQAERAELLASIALTQLKEWASADRKQRLKSPAVALASKSGHLRELEAYALLVRAHSHLNQDDAPRAEEDLAAFMDIVQSSPTKHDFIPYALELLILAKLKQKDWTQAVTIAQTQVDRARDQSDLTHLSRGLALLAEAEIGLKQLDQARTDLAAASDFQSRLNDGELRGDVLRVQSQLAQASGELEEALRLADAALDAYSAAGSSWVNRTKAMRQEIVQSLHSNR